MESIPTRSCDADRAGASLMPNRPRTPGIVYGAATIVLLVVLASIALSTRQPPPPTIAEFAPQAVEQITEADQTGTASVGGSGVRDLGATQPTPAPERLEATIDVPRVRRCVGDP